jgi:hypothetical protein
MAVEHLVRPASAGKRCPPSLLGGVPRSDQTGPFGAEVLQGPFLTNPDQD